MSSGLQLKPLTQAQLNEVDSEEAYKHKSSSVICGNFAAWGERSTGLAVLAGACRTGKQFCVSHQLLRQRHLGGGPHHMPQEEADPKGQVSFM